MEIFVSREGQTFGPYPLDQVKEMVGSGSLMLMDLAWSEQEKDWLPLYKVAGIAPRQVENRARNSATVDSHVSTDNEPTSFLQTSVRNNDVTEEDIALYAGIRNRHYVKAWTNYDTPSLFRRISGNIGFLACSFVWLFYRKMYLYAFITVIIAFTLVALQTRNVLPPATLLQIYGGITVVYIAFSVYYVDRIYIKRAEAAILAIKSNEKNRIRQKELIKKAGGTHPILALVMLAAVAVLPSMFNSSITTVNQHENAEVSAVSKPATQEKSHDQAKGDSSTVLDASDSEVVAMFTDQLGYKNVKKLPGIPSRFCGKRYIIAGQQGNDPVVAFPISEAPVVTITSHSLAIGGDPGNIKAVFSGDKENVQYVFAVSSLKQYSAFWAADARLRVVYPGADCTFQMVGNPDLKSVLSAPMKP